MTTAAKKAAATKADQAPVVPAKKAAAKPPVADVTDGPTPTDHLTQATIACQSRDVKSPEFATAWAMLALAEEQRTANLIAVLALPETAWADLFSAGVDAEDGPVAVAREVAVRLGLVDV